MRHSPSGAVPRVDVDVQSWVDAWQRLATSEGHAAVHRFLHAYSRAIKARDAALERDRLTRQQLREAQRHSDAQEAARKQLQQRLADYHTRLRQFRLSMEPAAAPANGEPKRRARRPVAAAGFVGRAPKPRPPPTRTSAFGTTLPLSLRPAPPPTAAGMPAPSNAPSAAAGPSVDPMHEFFAPI